MTWTLDKVMTICLIVIAAAEVAEVLLLKGF